MSRSYLSRVSLVLVALVMAFSMLAACGGGDDDDGGNGGGGDFPAPSGADRLGEEDISAEDVDAGDADISDAKAVAYRVSDSSMDDVASFYESDPQLRAAIALIASGAFSDGDRMVFEPVVSNLLGDDRFLALADYRSYIDAQERVDKAYADQDAWSRSAILNVARSGFFSSDRAMRNYIDRIWHTPPVLDD